ncbi:MAG: DUF4397 domain-containing protein [Lachnospiraceae bacterium]
MAESIYTAMAVGDGYPVPPLPNPGEGGPIPDFDFPPDTNPDNGGTPVVPLPNPGEGGPLPPFPENNGNTPMIPLPNPGEGGPVSGGNTNSSGGILGSIITVIPRPIIPCYFCNSTQYGTVRFLNAASGYNPFLIYIGNQLVVNSLGNAEISQYGRVSAGRQTITVSGQNGYVYIQKSITVRSGQAMTVAIFNTANGLDLMEITDNTCQAGTGTGCFRACNLSVTNQSLNVSLNRNYVTFQGLSYKQITGAVYLPMGSYLVQVFNNPSFTGNSLVSSSLYVRPGTSYTLYIFNWNSSRDAIRTLVVEDRQA